MPLFRNILVVMTIVILIATIAAVADGGVNLITPYVSPIFALNWQGQFNIDFACYLILSGLWMAWRSGYSGRGIVLGLFAPPLGILFLAPYLIYLISQTSGDIRKLLLGVHAETEATT